MNDSAKATALKPLLFQCIRQYLSEEGFRSDAKRSIFVRRYEDITEIFYVTCTNAKPGHWVTPGVGLRFDAVEEIFHRTSGWDTKLQKNTNTVGTQVGVLIDGKGTSCRFLLESESEIASVTEKVVGVFRKFALPYFVQFGSLAAIDAELNDHPAERSVNSSLAWFRCSRGLIVAKLMGRPDYEQLVTIYTDVITRDNKGFYLKGFQALVESLKSV
jgi:hypothetical protein